MQPIGESKPASSSPGSRFVVVLSNFPTEKTLATHKVQRKSGFSSAGKLRASTSYTFLGPKPTANPEPNKSTLEQHLKQLRNHPLLSRLFKDNVHVQRLSTPNTLKTRLPLHLKQASVNWLASKKRALLTSIYTSSESLSCLVDTEPLHLGTGEAEKTLSTSLVTVPLEPLNAVGKRINTSFSRPKEERTKAKKAVSTERMKKRTARKSVSRLSSKLTEKVPLKEACRYRDWATKARIQLQSDFFRLLRQSNGVSLCSPKSASPYTYYLGKGNNHSLVKSCFKARSWLRLSDESELVIANVVWTQGKIKSLIADFPVSDSPTYTPRTNKPISLRCNVKVYTKNEVDNRGRTVDVKALGFELITKSKSFAQAETTWNVQPQTMRTHNKLEHNYHLTNKKSLFCSIKTYCELLEQDPFTVIPLTFHIKSGVADPEFAHFLSHYNAFKDERQRNIWIVKPGENTNRGCGIVVCSSLDSIKSELSPQSGRTYILQKYIENPFLVYKRKFDIRCYALATAINGVLQGYFFQEGYLRTSSKEFSLKDVSNRFIHLTNDAVQKNSEDYGRFEAGNKLSYSDFQRYLDAHYGEAQVDFQRDILTQIRAAVKTTFSATFAKLNSSNRVFSFEIFGYDFILDAKLKVWLIEVNTNPCLELSSPLLARIIPRMLENALRIAIDPYYVESPAEGRRPSTSYTGGSLPENRFELVFSSLVDGAALKSDLGLKFYRLEVSGKSDEDDTSDCSRSETGC